jgi:hypothetical protein
MALALLSLSTFAATIVPPVEAATCPGTGPTWCGENFYFNLMSNTGFLNMPKPNYASGWWPNVQFWGQHQSGSGSATLSIDGTAQGCQTTSGSSCTTSGFSTSHSNDLIMIQVFGDSVHAPTVSSGVGTISLRQSQTSGHTNAEYYGIASSPLSSVTATCTDGGTFVSCVMFAISGANTASPFDPNSSSKCSANGSFTGPGTVTMSCNVSTSHAVDMLLGLGATNHYSSVMSAGTGFTFITHVGFVAEEYETVNTVSNYAISMSDNQPNSASESWWLLGDSIQAASTGGTSTNSCDNQYPTGTGWPEGQGTGSYGCKQFIDPRLGFVQAIKPNSSGNIGYQGLYISQALTATSTQGWTVSVQTANDGSSMGTFWELVKSSDFSSQLNPDFTSSNHFVEAGLASGIPYFNVDVGSGTINVYIGSSSVQWAEWLVQESKGSNNNPQLNVWLNTGTGYTKVVTNYQNGAGLNWLTSGGGGYQILQARSGDSSVVHHAYFGFLSVWQPSQAVAEGTLDNNVWALGRHYEKVSATGSPYNGEAVMTDTDDPPLRIVATGGGYSTSTLFSGQFEQSPLSYISGYSGPGLCGQQYSSCLWNSYVTSLSGNSQTVRYDFANNCLAGFAGGGSSCEMYSVSVTNQPTGSGDNVTYTTQVNTNSGPTGRTYSVYLGPSTIYSGLSSNGSPPSSKSVDYGTGLSGNRYVGRHITEVAGYLLAELGYATGGQQQSATTPLDMADPLLNFMSSLQTQCHNSGGSYACGSSTYTDYYTPLFPSKDCSTCGFSDTWYYSDSTWPESNFYTVAPFSGDSYGDTFALENSGASTNAQFSFPYFSRLSLVTPAVPSLQFLYYATADNLWEAGVQQYGFSASTSALRSAHYIDRYGSTDLTLAQQLLESAGWDGYGPSLQVCVGTGISILGHKVQYCNDQTSYPTYNTATFLAAASLVAAQTGGTNSYQTWAEQAASVLEQALWSGTGYVAGVSGTIQEPQWTGGELAAYEPLAVDPVQYQSNQGGFFGDVSNALSLFGIQGVQQPETAGFSLTDTEATGLSASALYVFLKELPNYSETGGVGTAISSQGEAQTPSVTASGTYVYTTNLGNGVRFNTTTSASSISATWTETQSFSGTVTNAETFANFVINGTVSSGAVATAELKVKNSGGTVISDFTNSTTFSGPNKITRAIGVSTAEFSLSPGTYTLQAVFTYTGVGTFYSQRTSSTQEYYLGFEGAGIIPNSVDDNEITNQNYGTWLDTYYQSTGSRTYAQNSGLPGLAVTLASASGSYFEEAFYTDNSYSYTNDAIHFSFRGEVSSQGQAAPVCFGVSPTKDTTGATFTSLTNYAEFCFDGSKAYVNYAGTTSGSSVCPGTLCETSVNQNTVDWEITISTTGKFTVLVGYGDTPSFHEFASTPFTTTWTSGGDNVYVYELSGTTSTSNQVVGYQDFAVNANS